MDQTKMLFWEYDYWKTRQEFNIDIRGIMSELQFMSTKEESSEIWKQKAMNVETQMNLIFPKFSSKYYPHHMLKLELATTLVGLHIGLMTKLSHILAADKSYTIDDVNYKID